MQQLLMFLAHNTHNGVGYLSYNLCWNFENELHTKDLFSFILYSLIACYRNSVVCTH